MCQDCSGDIPDKSKQLDTETKARRESVATVAPKGTPKQSYDPRNPTGGEGISSETQSVPPITPPKAPSRKRKAASKKPAGPRAGADG